MIFLLSFLFLASNSEAFLDEISLKRSWSRRLISEDQKLNTSVYQTIKPVFLPKNKILQGSSFGELYLINKWGRKKLVFDAKEGLSGSPVVKGDFAFIGLQNKSLLALNYKTKESLWKIQLDSAPTSISDVSEGLIFIQTESGSLYSIDSGDGTVNWKTQSQGTKDLKIYGDPKPILYGSDVIVGFESGVVIRLNKKTGKVIWQKNLPGGKKYSDVQYLRLSKDRSFLLAGIFDEAVYRIDIASGQVQWQAFDKPVSDFSIDTDSLYFSSAEGDLIKLKQTTGTQVLKKRIFKGVGGKPLIVNNNIIVGDTKGPIYQVNKNTFENKSLYEFFYNISAPFAYDSNQNAMYLLSNKGYLFRMKLVYK